MAQAEKPDLIITDLAMPNVDGTQMIRQLRAEPEIADTPVLVFTAHGSVSPEAIKEAGADQAFYKPFDFDEMVKIVREMIPQSDDG